MANPSGICPRCGKPLDDHVFRERGPWGERLADVAHCRPKVSA